MLGNITHEPGPAYLRRVYAFDTGIAVTITNNRISHISFSYGNMDEEMWPQIHFNVLNASATSVDVRNVFGEPDEEGDFGYYIYQNRTRSTLLVVRFDVNGNFEGVNYMTMP